MFLICLATNYLVDKNNVMYGLHTNIVPQYGYEGTCAAADTQPFLNKVFQFGIDCISYIRRNSVLAKKSYSFGISIFYIHT